MHTFNTTGVCIPEKHYMVDVSDKIDQIKLLIDRGCYFTINRARQYGKTTILTALAKALESDYTVVSLDFQGISAAGFRTEQIFVQELSRLILGRLQSGLVIPDEIRNRLENYIGRNENKAKLGELFDTLTKWCTVSEKEIVLIIDEVDSATNNQVFLDFLAQIRDGYLKREASLIPAFKSVILAGVTDVKHMKSRIRDDEQHKVNSPWNIATDFDVVMKLDEKGVERMLSHYASEHGISLDSAGFARDIIAYTNGYPYLVSRICQILDEKLVPSKYASLDLAWTKAGFLEAVKMLINDDNTLFESLTGKLENYPNLKTVLKSILMEGVSIPFNGYQEELSQMKMYGFIEANNGFVAIDNRIFESFLYNLFLSEEVMQSNVFFKRSGIAGNKFVSDGKLQMRQILDGFIRTYTEVLGPLQDRFKEKDGRELFLLYLKPIINGTGNYYIEAQTRDQTRTDVVVDYLGQQYIIELKIWHGERYNSDGEQQLSEYLDYFNLDVGYMLSFNFNKTKEQGVKRVEVGDKVLFEGTL